MTSRRTRVERTRLYSRVALLFLPAVIAVIRVVTGHRLPIGWTVVAAALAFTSVSVLIAHLTDKNEV